MSINKAAIEKERDEAIQMINGLIAISSDKPGLLKALVSYSASNLTREVGATEAIKFLSQGIMITAALEAAMKGGETSFMERAASIVDNAISGLSISRQESIKELLQ